MNNQKLQLTYDTQAFETIAREIRRKNMPEESPPITISSELRTLSKLPELPTLKDFKFMTKE